MLEETIKEMVKAAVLEALHESEINWTSETNEAVMTMKQLAEYLQCSVPWLSKNINKLSIPCRQMGQKVYRFKKSEIDNWLANKDHNKDEKVKISPVKIKHTEMKII